MAPDDIRDAADDRRDATDADPAARIGRGVDAATDGESTPPLDSGADAPLGGENISRPATQLRHDVVTYSDGPDRCTIYPPDATGVVRMSTWLTADRDAFVDLATVR